MKYPVKLPAALLCGLFFHFSIVAQDKLPIKFGKVAIEDFDVKSALIDSSTSAVVVADLGSTEFIANNTDLTFSLIFKEKKRIKIITKNGFGAATVTIPLYVSGNKSETLSDLDAFTYNIENGNVVKTKIENRYRRLIISIYHTFRYGILG